MFFSLKAISARNIFTKLFLSAITWMSRIYNICARKMYLSYLGSIIANCNYSPWLKKISEHLHNNHPLISLTSVVSAIAESPIF